MGTLADWKRQSTVFESLSGYEFATVNLTAPTSGTYKGVLLYGDRTGTFTSNKINGTASSTMTGAMYFPSQEVDMLGNFSGAGEHARRGGRTSGIVGQTTKRNHTDKHS